MVYLGREVTSHMRGEAAAAHRGALSWALCALRALRHSYFDTKQGHWAVLSANTRSHQLQPIVEFGMGISDMGVVTGQLLSGWVVPRSTTPRVDSGSLLAIVHFCSVGRLLPLGSF